MSENSKSIGETLRDAGLQRVIPWTICNRPPRFKNDTLSRLKMASSQIYQVISMFVRLSSSMLRPWAWMVTNYLTSSVINYQVPRPRNTRIGLMKKIQRRVQLNVK